jgi:modulator of FtsH protease
MAQVGASAALAGLIFVGLSINMSRVLSLPRVPERGLQTITVLLTVLLVSSLQLVPGQTTQEIGLEMLAIGAVVWVFSTWLDIGNLRHMTREVRKYWIQNAVLGQAALLPYIIGGLVTLTIGADGIYFLVPAILFSFLKAIIDSWVLLIEINR